MRQIALASVMAVFVVLPAASQPAPAVNPTQQAPVQTPQQAPAQAQPTQQTPGTAGTATGAVNDTQKSQLRQQGIQTIEQGLNLLRQSQ